MLVPTTGASFPHQTKEHSSYQYTSANCFRGTAQKLVDLNTFRFLFVGTLNLQVYSAPTDNEYSLHQRILMPVKPFATAPGLLKACYSTRSDVSMHVLIQTVGILSICCEL